jgi:hypothetical protein
MNKKLWGTVFGVSMGLMIGSQMTSSNRKKMMKKSRKLTSNMMDGIQNMWD